MKSKIEILVILNILIMWPKYSIAQQFGVIFFDNFSNFPEINDSGQSFCASTTTGGLSCGQILLPRQDGDNGRDALARLGQLNKVGAGDAGFDYTKISNSGNVLPFSAALGSGPNDWACTRDNVTGLIWEVKVNNPNNLRHLDHTFTWYSTNPTQNGGQPGDIGVPLTCNNTLSRCNTESYVAAVNAQRLCGASDWRLPTISELMSIKNFGRNTTPLIDPNFFINTRGSGLPSIFWSSNVRVDNATEAWFMQFQFSSHFRSGKFLAHGVRLVRSR